MNQKGTYASKVYDNVDFSPFDDEIEFTLWVEREYGTDVVPIYRAKMDEMLAQDPSQRVAALSIVDEIMRKTRAMDFSKKNLRARFPY